MGEWTPWLEQPEGLGLWRGVEIGPKDIGLSGISLPAGARLRLQIDTYDFDSIRPMAGVVFHF